MPPVSPPHADDRNRLIGFLLLVALIALTAGAKSILYDTLDPDCFWHLRVAEQLAHDGIGPLRDSLSFASLRQPWTPYSWLAELGMSRVWALGGYRAAVLCAALLISGIVLFIAAACREAIGASLDDGAADALVQSHKWLATSLAVAFSAILSLPYLSFRPVTAALLLLALCAWLIFRDRRAGENSRAIWLVPLLAVLLVNLHLFAVLVPIWFLALLAGAVWERVRLFDPADRPHANHCARRYTALCALSTLACLATPMLPGMIGALRHYGLHDPMVASNVIGEMQPFWHGGLGKLSLALVLLFAANLFAHHRRLRIGEILMLAVGALLLLWKGRFAPVFVLVAAPAFAVTMPALSDQLLGRPLLRRVVACVLMLGIARTAIDFPSRQTNLDAWINRNGPTAPGYPVEAAAFVSAHIPRDTGRLLNEFNWGGYLEWRLGDRYQVLLDGRTQVFSPQFWNEVYLGDDASRRSYLTRVRADAAVLPLGHSRLKSTLVSLGWKTVHKDDRAEVLVPSADLVGMDRE